MASVNGFDISAYQEAESLNLFIDWQRIKSDPRQFKFVIIKSTEGDHWGEEYGGYPQHVFHRQLAGADSIGLLTGCYHYYCSWLDPIKQADWFYDVAGDDAQVLDFPPMLDFEDPLVRIPTIVDIASGNRALAIARHEAEQIRIMVDATDQKFGVASLIYSGSWWWNPIFDQKLYWDGPKSIEWIARHPCLNANYSGTEPPKLMTGFPTTHFHQYTSTPALPVAGIPTPPKTPGSACDLDHWEGTEAEFYAWLGHPVPPEADIETRLSNLEKDMAKVKAVLNL